jgi:hypothetical protein
MLYKTWSEIRRDLNEGAHFEHPTPGKIATADEYGEFSDKCTGPLMEFIKLSAEAAAHSITVMSENGPVEPAPMSEPPKKVTAPATNGNGNANGQGTRWVNEHPICVAYTSAIADLCDLRSRDLDANGIVHAIWVELHRERA